MCIFDKIKGEIELYYPKKEEPVLSWILPV